MPEQYNQEGMVHTLRAQLVVMWGGQGFIIVYSITSELSFRCVLSMLALAQSKTEITIYESVEEYMFSSVCSVVYCKLEPGCRKTEGLRVSGCRKTEGFRQTLEENREPNDRVCFCSR